MANKNQKHENQPEQQPTPQPTAPATPLELSEEELGQVTGGFNPQPDPPGVVPPDRS
jgi:mersacidin/lichenicidin family type 2 lantibiotic